MAGTINYQYDPNQEVYVINTCSEKPYITTGTVIRVRAEVLVTETKVAYDIRLANNAGTSAFLEDDVFPDKATALIEYETRV
jgi:hypothetical protein